MVNKPDTGEKKNLMTARHKENSRDGHEDGVPQDEVLGVKPRAFKASLVELLLKVGVLLAQDEVFGVKPRAFKVHLVELLPKVGDILAQDEVISVIPRAFEVHLLEMLLKVGEPLAQDEVIGVKPRGFKDLKLMAIGLEDILKHSLNDHSAQHIYTGTDMPSMQRAQMLLMERADLIFKTWLPVHSND